MVLQISCDNGVLLLSLGYVTSGPFRNQHDLATVIHATITCRLAYRSAPFEGVLYPAAAPLPKPNLLQNPPPKSPGIASPGADKPSAIPSMEFPSCRSCCDQYLGIS